MTSHFRDANESNNLMYFKKHVDDKDSGTEFAQIKISLSLVHVRESNNVLQAVQTNPTLFIKLGNKRNVLGCLTECLTKITLQS